MEKIKKISKSLSENIKNNKTLTIGIILALAASIAIFVFIFRKNENFSKPEPEPEQKIATAPFIQYTPPPINTDANLYESDQRKIEKELVIEPPNLNPDTRTIMASEGFIPQKEIIPAWGKNNYGAIDDLDDGAGGNMGLHYNLCSPSCCSSQYPTPHKLAKDPLVCGREGEFVPSSITCQNSWQNSGCACLTKKQASFLTNRGGN